MDQKSIDVQISACRDELLNLERQRGQIDTKLLEDQRGAVSRRLIELRATSGQAVAPFSEEPPRIYIGVTSGEYREILELARRASTSVSALGQLAIRHLLIQSRLGALPMLPVSRIDTAETVTCLGNPVPNYPT